MASLNKVLLMGNLTKDPELRYTPGGSAVTDFGLAINRTYTSNGEKKEETCFVDINVWGKQAESVSKYLKKGSPAFIEGRLQLDQWDDKESGKKRSRLKVVAERVQFLSSPKNGGSFDEQGAVGNSGVSQGFQAGGDYNQTPQAAAPAYQQTAAPNVPPPMPSPAPAPVAQNNAFAPQQPPVAPTAPQAAAAPGNAQQAPSAGSMPPQAPQPPANAFNPSTETEDDIPF